MSFFEEPNTLLKNPGLSFVASLVDAIESILRAMRGSEYCLTGLGFLDFRKPGGGWIRFEVRFEPITVVSVGGGLGES